MARVTIEDCLKNVDNMYELVHLATKRTRQLYKGSDPLVDCKNREVVTSLREIASGNVKAAYASASQEDEMPPVAN
jgi:DNA-directed RNA polymerase subunit omega